MKTWIDAMDSDLQLFKAISIILLGRSHLLHGLFNPILPRLREDPTILVKHYSHCLSQEEFILIKVSLDLWCNSGKAKLNEIFYNLDTPSFLNVINGLLIAKRIRTLDPDF